MNWDRVEGNWKQLKGKVQEKWGDLTDDDFDRIAGQREQLIGEIQTRYGIAKDEAEKKAKDEKGAKVEAAAGLASKSWGDKER